MQTKQVAMGAAFSALAGVAALLLRLTGSEGWAFALVVALILLAGFFGFALSKQMAGKTRSGAIRTIDKGRVVKRIVQMVATLGLAICSIPMLSSKLPPLVPFLFGAVLFLTVAITYAPLVLIRIKAKADEIIVKILITLCVAALLLFTVFAGIALLQGNGESVFLRWQLPVCLLIMGVIDGYSAFSSMRAYNRVLKEANRRMRWNS